MGTRQSSGAENFLTHDDCADANKDKNVVVQAKLEFPGEVTKMAGKESAKAPKKQKLSVLDNKMTRADFTLVFQRTVAMVENKHRESIESKANFKLSAEVGRAFVRFIYTAVLENEHTLAFLEMGEKYDLHGLKNLAEKEFLGQLEKENMVKMQF